MMMSSALCLGFAPVAAHASVTISGGKTRFMTCAAGVCAPTAATAVLNVTQLTGMLASGNVKVSTTGPGVQANDLVVNSSVAWSSSGGLTLDAWRSLTIAKKLSVNGAGSVALATNDGGSDGALSFGAKARIAFANLSSQVLINGTSFALVGSVSSLAAAVSANPSGNYALANNYNARRDRTYSASPVATTLTGSFEGLGNTISNLSIDAGASDASVGLFAELGVDSGNPGPSVADLHLSNVAITASGGGNVGALAGLSYNSIVTNITVSGSIAGSNGGFIGGVLGIAENTSGLAFPYGTISGAQVSASVSTSGTAYGLAGGVVGDLGGAGAIVFNSHTTGPVSAEAADAAAGGIAGVLVGSAVENCYATGGITALAFAGGVVGGTGDFSTIENSFATGAVSATGIAGVGGQAGGLLGSNFDSTIINSYAVGSVTGVADSLVGGLVGDDENGTYEYSYATGALSAGGSSEVGGIIGAETDNGDTATDVYWDTQTTGVGVAIGANGNASGMTGLTTAELQSGLPAGFDPATWNESASINTGFPYLIANPPP